VNCGADSTAFAHNKLLELELWHTWTSETYKTFCTSDQDYHGWQVAVPKLALKFEFLFQAVLATSSLYTAAESTAIAVATHRERYAVSALQFHNSALETFRAVSMNDMKAEKAQAIFAFCVLNLALTLAFPQHHHALDDDRTSVLEGITMVIGLLQGTRSIFLSNLALLKQSAFCKGDPMNEPWQGIDAATQEAMDRLRSISSRESAVWSALDCVDPNIEAINWLQHCFGLGSKTIGVALIWPLKADLQFFKAIQDADSVALLVLLHWAVLMERMGRQTWWARDSGKLLVEELSPTIPRKDEEWHVSINWVREQVGLL
jgi:hypothetical protein